MIQQIIQFTTATDAILEAVDDENQTVSQSAKNHHSKTLNFVLESYNH